MNKREPLVTIITAVYNGEDVLEETMKSLFEQTYSNIQYIVIDGGSIDNTKNIILKYEDKIDYWVSEKDGGIADAWNKGLAKTDGELIGLLNAGDLYDKESISIVVNAYEQNPEDAVYYGKTVMFTNDISDSCETIDALFKEELIHCGFGFVHTSCFIAKSVYDKVGYFDNSYRIAIDTDFLLRCHKKGVTFKQLENVTYMRDGGISETQRFKANFEFYNQLLKYGYPKFKILITMFRFLKEHYLQKSVK